MLIAVTARVLTMFYSQTYRLEKKMSKVGYRLRKKFLKSFKALHTARAYVWLAGRDVALI